MNNKLKIQRRLIREATELYWNLDKVYMELWANDMTRQERINSVYRLSELINRAKRRIDRRIATEKRIVQQEKQLS